MIIKGNIFFILIEEYSGSTNILYIDIWKTTSSNMYSNVSFFLYEETLITFY
jgi:hypothetical protein